MTAPTITRIPLAWHEQTELEVAIAYDAGFTAGIEYASRAVDAAIREAIDPGPDVNPGARHTILSRSAKDVVATLLRDMYRAERRVYLPPRTDHTGGQVAYDRETS